MDGIVSLYGCGCMQEESTDLSQLHVFRLLLLSERLRESALLHFDIQ
jgi:hypothetical protein